MAALSTLKDDFDDNSRDTSKWNQDQAEGSGQGSTTVTETNQQLELLLDKNTVGYDGYGSVNTYDLTGDRCFVRVLGVPASGNTFAEAFFKLTADRTQGSVAMWVNQGNLLASTWTGGSRNDIAFPTYSATTHAWWSIRESAGTIYFDTAPSTASNPPVPGDWVNLTSATTPSDFAVTATKAYLFAGIWNSSSGTVAGTAIFDGFNTGTVAVAAGVAQGPTLGIRGPRFRFPAGTQGDTTSSILPTQIAQAIGTWSWLGSTSSTTQLINQSVGTWSWAGTTATTNSVLSGILGAWQWAGTTATLSQLIVQIAGVWTWAGTTSATTQLLNATPGTWSWAASTATTSQLLNAAPGAWTWAGATATLGSGIAATPGTWSWAGTTATIPTQVSAGVGAWSWAGTTGTLNNSLSATPGTWSWAGKTATTNQLINATPGLWSWLGSTSTATGLIAALPGTFSWTGRTATTTQLINATVGSYAWAGRTAVLGGPIAALPGTFTWTGTAATFGPSSVPGRRANRIGSTLKRSALPTLRRT